MKRVKFVGVVPIVLAAACQAPMSPAPLASDMAAVRSQGGPRPGAMGGGNPRPGPACGA